MATSAVAAPKTSKRAVSPRSGASIPVGGKVGNSGGTKGHSGRRPQKWGDFIAELRESDEKFRAALRAAAHDHESKSFGHVLKLVREYDPEAPERKISVQANTTMTLRVEYAQPPALSRGGSIGSASWEQVG